MVGVTSLPQSETMPAIQLFPLPNPFRFICFLPSNVSFNTSNTIQIVFLAIVLGKLEMCLQENLVDCADCGGLGVTLVKQ